MDFDKAIKAHIQWKQKLTICITESECDFEEKEVCKDNICDLGKWLYQQTSDQLIKDPIFIEIMEKHKRFHQIAGGIIERSKRNEKMDVDVELGSESEYGKISNRLIALLMRMRVKDVKF